MFRVLHRPFLPTHYLPPRGVAICAVGLQVLALSDLYEKKQILKRRLFGESRGPAQAEGIGTAIVFALDWINFAALVETENFIVQIQKGRDQVKIPEMWHAIDQLGVDLSVGIQIDVPIRALYATRRAAREVVRENIGIIVREAHACRNRAFVVGCVKVPVV